MIHDEYCWMHTDQAYKDGYRSGGNWNCSACNMIAFFEALALWARADAIEED